MAGARAVLGPPGCLVIWQAAAVLLAALVAVLGIRLVARAMRPRPPAPALPPEDEDGVTFA